MISCLTLIPFMLTSPPDGFDAKRLAALDARLASAVKQEEVAGVVALVRRNGKDVYVAAHGLAHVPSGRPMKRDTVFQVMSMTKPVTAIAVLICAERGLLNLDDSVENYLPNVARQGVRQADGTVKPRGRTMTIRHLLTHTSGLSSDDPGGLDDDAKRKLTLAEYAARFGDGALQSEPGERISYSGPGISAAGRIVEIASGKPFDAFLQEEVFSRLGMRSTAFFLSGDMGSRLAYVYFREGKALVALGEDPSRPGARFANPAGGLYSTADDMARLLECLLRAGAPILSRRGVTALTTLQTGQLAMDGQDVQGYGLGFTVVRNPAGTPHLRPPGSFGHTGAFCTEFWADPSSGTVSVFLTQSFSDRIRKSYNTMLNAAWLGR